MISILQKNRRGKQFLAGLGLLAFLVFLVVGSSPITQNDQWWVSWWVCEYADGTKVYNSFRLERDSGFVVSRVNGTIDGGCDFFTVIDGIEHHICYDIAGAAEMMRRHGQILSVRKEVPPPHRPSREPMTARRGD